MKIVEPSAEVILEQDPYKRIEFAGRTCYKSEAKITDESAVKFVQKLISSGHFAMLEHAPVTFEFYFDTIQERDQRISEIYLPFSRYLPSVAPTLVTYSLRHLYDPFYYDGETISCTNHNIVPILRNCFINYQSTGNCSYEATLQNRHLKVVYIEPNRLPEIFRKYSSGFASADKFEELMNTHETYSVKFVCDRGVSHELVRHRASFAQESTRYCNYSKDKFGNEITVVKPSTVDIESEAGHSWLHSCQIAEIAYLNMLEHGCTAQQARAVLPNSLKTEVVMTASLGQWRHFADLRVYGKTGAPHPDMQFVATKAWDALTQARNLIYNEDC